LAAGQLNEGYIIDVTASDSTCVTHPCALGSFDAADQAICCNNDNSKVTPFECHLDETYTTQTYQNKVPLRLKVDANGLFQLERYNPVNGRFITYSEIGKWLTTPQFTELNACQINPIDRIIYCIMSGPSSNPYIMNLVRMDRDTVSFIAKVAGQSFAGTVDADGDYIWYRSPGQPSAAGTLTGKEVFYLPMVHKMRGYTTSNASPDLTTQVSLFNFQNPAPGTPGATEIPLDPSLDPTDLVYVTADFDGTGEAKWAVGLGNGLGGNRLLLAKYSGTGAPKAYNPQVTMEDGSTVGSNVKGSGWTYANEMFFSFNGVGIFQVLIKTTSNVAKLKRVSVADPSMYINTATDGLNCPTTIPPFATCGDMNGPVELYGARFSA
jgi:hypothetical protein